jgi:AcrR family transcriptional regulator
MRMKTEDRRQAIMRAALSVFGEVGYDRASMDEIAARLGCSKATLYGYFSSKEELFATALLESHSDEAAVFLDTLDPDRDDVSAVLEAFGRAYLEFNTSPRLLDNKRSALAQGAASSLGPMLYDRGPRQSTDTVKDYLQGLMLRGLLRPADPAVAALHLQGLLEAGVVEPRLFGAAPRITIDQAAALATEVFMRAYGAATGDAPTR